MCQEGAVLRWQMNRKGRPLSPPQIHWKDIWTLSKLHKTTSERWQRTSGTQTGSPFSLKGGRTKYKRETKELGMETHPGKGVLKEKFPNTRKPSHRQVCGEFWNLIGWHNWEEKINKERKPTDYMPNGNSQQKSTPDTHIRHQQVGAEWGRVCCIA